MGGGRLINNSSIPVLTFHGDRDKSINVEYSEAIQKRLESIGSTGSHRIVMEGRGHAQYRYVSQNLMDELVGFLDGVRSTK